MATDLIRISPLTRTDYRDLISPVGEAVWPEFMMHDSVAGEHWDGLFETFGEYQFALLREDGRQVVGLANSVPLAWDAPVEKLPDEGWDWALRQSARDRAENKSPKTLCAIQISIHPDHQGRGLSAIMLKEMLALARQRKLGRLIAPVRPSLKSIYPLTAMADYIRWTDDSGLPFDPWLRVHARLGGRIVKVCQRAMQVIGTIGEWETWTGLRFPDDGEYIVPGALVPIRIDRSLDRGTYVEPNVWTSHFP
jgi:GNAT superfamily N-acetyltransferase